MIAAILLVPAEGDPHGLLAEGPCGARPPMAWLRGRRDGIWRPAPWFPDEREPLWALVLAWDGQPVAEGMDRATRIDPHYRGVAWASARNLGAEMERLDYGTLVLLDADGREVSNE